MQEEKEAETEATTVEEPFKVPSYLDIKMEAMVGKAVYDKIVMYDLVGNLRIKDEEITFSEISRECWMVELHFLEKFLQKIKSHYLIWPWI